MKDRVGNELVTGDKVLVMLPESQIFGFVAQIDKPSLISNLRRTGGVQDVPGRILVSCVIALPIDPEYDSVGQLVKVYDPDKHDDNPGQGGKPN
jgi:hypothetical protein